MLYILTIPIRLLITIVAVLISPFIICFLDDIENANAFPDDLLMWLKRVWSEND